jgi:hypothetical protein
MKPRLRISSISDVPVCFRFGSPVSTADIGRTSLIIYITAPTYQRLSFFNSQHVVSSSSAINDQTIDEALPRNEEAHTAGVLSREMAIGFLIALISKCGVAAEFPDDSPLWAKLVVQVSSTFIQVNRDKQRFNGGSSEMYLNTIHIAIPSRPITSNHPDTNGKHVPEMHAAS